MRERRPLDPDGERQAVRMLSLLVGLVALVSGVILLALASYIAAVGCAVVALLTGALAARMFGELHQEQIARIAQGQAIRAVADPFGDEDRS